MVRSGEPGGLITYSLTLQPRGSGYTWGPDEPLDKHKDIGDRSRDWADRTLTSNSFYADPDYIQTGLERLTLKHTLTPQR